MGDILLYHSDEGEPSPPTVAKKDRKTVDENRGKDGDHPGAEKTEQNGDQVWAALCHFSALLGLMWWVPAGMDVWLPFGHLVGPLVVWLIKKGESSFINNAGKESLNFQVTMTFYGFIAGRIPLPMELSLIPLLVVADSVLVVIAGVQTSKGEPYRYPLVPIRWIQ